MRNIAMYILPAMLVAVLVSICPLHAASSRASNAPGTPYLIYPEDDSAWPYDLSGTSVQLYASAGYGPAPTMFRFIVWGPDGWEWVSPWIAGAVWARCWTPRLPYGNYCWAAQTASGRYIGGWQRQRGRFRIAHALRSPRLLYPENGAVLGTRQVIFRWADGEDLGGRYGGGPIHRLKVWRNGAQWIYDSDWSIRGNSTSITLPSGGTYQWKVAASDGWNRGDFSQTSEFTFDSEPPRISIAGPNVGQWTNFASLSWSVVDGVGSVAKVVLHWDGGREQVVSASGSTRVPEGKRTVTIRAQDGVGNSGSASGGPYWVDTMAPTIAMNVSPTEPLRKANLVNLGWIVGVSTNDYNGSGVASAACSVDGGSPSPNYGTIVFSDPGTHTCAVVAIDNAGNSARVSRSVTVQQQAAASPSPVPSPRPSARPAPEEKGLPSAPRPSFEPGPIQTLVPRVTPSQEPASVVVPTRVYQPTEKTIERPPQNKSVQPVQKTVQPVEEKPVANPEPAKEPPVQKQEQKLETPTEKPTEQPVEKTPPEKQKSSPSSGAGLS